MTSGGERRSIRASDGAVLRYEVLGSSPPVVLFHSSLAGRDSFAHQHALADRFHLILPDLRGHNGSEARVPPGSSIDTAEVGDGAASLAAEAIDRAHPVSHSTGGAIAVAFARRYPQRVERLVLLEPTLLALAVTAAHGPQIAAIRAASHTAAANGDAAAAGSVMTGMTRLADWETRLPPAVVTQVMMAAAMRAPHARSLFALELTPEKIGALEPPILYLRGTGSPVRSVAGRALCAASASDGEHPDRGRSPRNEAAEGGCHQRRHPLVLARGQRLTAVCRRPVQGFSPRTVPAAAQPAARCRCDAAPLTAGVD